MENTQEKKIKHLESLGFSIEGFSHEDVAFEIDGYFADIDFDQFEVGDSYDTIYNRSNLYSCCGDILDRDYMICPSCKEHC